LIFLDGTSQLDPFLTGVVTTGPYSTAGKKERAVGSRDRGNINLVTLVNMGLMDFFVYV